MIRLGVSVYPDIRPLEEIKEYLKLASTYGCKRVFSSMFSVEGTKEEILSYFKELIDIAHTYDMSVTLDVNPMCFKRVEASESDLAVFHQIGVDILRMDLCYGEEKDLELIANPYGILIEFNASIVTSDYIGQLINRGADPKCILVCHNFYPQRYTGMKWEKFKKANQELKQHNVCVGAFISSNAQNTHGVWDAKDGLCTVEKMRGFPIDLQLRMLSATNCVDDIIIGNAYASEEEFKLLQKAMEIVPLKADNPMSELMKSFGATVNFINNIDEQRKVKVILESDITEIEKDVLFKFFPHFDVGDSSEWIWRSRMPRFIYKNKTIPVRLSDKKMFERGAVVMVNNNYKNYAAEVQIVLEPIINDGQRNLLGHLDEQEMEMLELIREKDIVVFNEK